MQNSRKAISLPNTRLPFSPRRRMIPCDVLKASQIDNATPIAAALAPMKYQSSFAPFRGCSEPGAIATEMLPGPAVIGIVNGKKLIWAFSVCAAGFAWSGRFSNCHAFKAMMTPPAQRNAARLTPKKFNMPEPLQRSTTPQAIRPRRSTPPLARSPRVPLPAGSPPRPEIRTRLRSGWQPRTLRETREERPLQTHSSARCTVRASQSGGRLRTSASAPEKVRHRNVPQSHPPVFGGLPHAAQPAR